MKGKPLVQEHVVWIKKNCLQELAPQNLWMPEPYSKRRAANADRPLTLRFPSGRKCGLKASSRYDLLCRCNADL